MGGLADDGKRLGLSESALDVAWAIDKKCLQGEGIRVRGIAGIGPARRLADDGKRLGLSESALDVAFPQVS